MIKFATSSDTNKIGKVILHFCMVVYKLCYATRSGQCGHWNGTICRRLQVRGSQIRRGHVGGHVRALLAVQVQWRCAEMSSSSLSTTAKPTTHRMSRSFARRERLLPRINLQRDTLVRLWKMSQLRSVMLYIAKPICSKLELYNVK